jgi:molybdenum cofactor biosynthesis protein B
MTWEQGAILAVHVGWDEILEAQLDIRHRPCNFAELLPRLREHEAS